MGLHKSHSKNVSKITLHWKNFMLTCTAFI